MSFDCHSTSRSALEAGYQWLTGAMRFTRGRIGVVMVGLAVAAASVGVHAAVSRPALPEFQPLVFDMPPPLAPKRETDRSCPEKRVGAAALCQTHFAVPVAHASEEKLGVSPHDAAGFLLKRESTNGPRDRVVTPANADAITQEVLRHFLRGKAIGPLQFEADTFLAGVRTLREMGMNAPSKKKVRVLSPEEFETAVTRAIRRAAEEHQLLSVALATIPDDRLNVPLAAAIAVQQAVEREEEIDPSITDMPTRTAIALAGHKMGDGGVRRLERAVLRGDLSSLKPLERGYFRAAKKAIEQCLHARRPARVAMEATFSAAPLPMALTEASPTPKSGIAGWAQLLDRLGVLPG